MITDEWTSMYKSGTSVDHENSDLSGSEGNDFFQKLYKTQMGSAAKDSSDELQKFLSEPIMSSTQQKATSLLDWWKVNQNRIF